MMTAQGPSTRKLSSWVDAFLEFTESAKSPIAFRKWAAISTISGALERRVWTRSLGEDLFPNTYVFLVGPPATGKGIVKRIRALWKAVGDIYIAPTSITAAALGDALGEARVKIVRPAAIPPFVEYNSIQVASTELSVFLPSYDGEMMARLTDVWDCIEYDERRRGRETKLKIPNTQITIIAGTTPSYLNEMMPQGAWDQGFISRVVLVYSGEMVKKPLFGADSEERENEQLFNALVSDLKCARECFGKMEWSPEAARAVEAWDKAGNPPEPDHLRLKHYNGRRTQHVLKLSMIASLSRSNKLTIELEDYQTALGWLLEAENAMPDIFKAMRGTTGDVAAIDETWQYVFTTHMKEKRPVAETRILQFLSQRMPAHSVMRALELMQRNGLLIVEAVTEHGLALYKPGKRQE